MYTATCVKYTEGAVEEDLFQITEDAEPELVSRHDIQRTFFINERSLILLIQLG